MVVSLLLLALVGKSREPWLLNSGCTLNSGLEIQVAFTRRNFLKAGGGVLVLRQSFLALPDLTEMTFFPVVLVR